MSKELSGGADSDSGVFSLLRNFDRYNDDNFKLSETPPSGLNSPPNGSVQKNKLATPVDEKKNAVIVQNARPTVVGFSMLIPSLFNQEKQKTPADSGGIHSSSSLSRQLIKEENKLSTMTLGGDQKPVIKPSLPHDSIQSAPAPNALIKLYEKAVSRTSQSQPSSPQIERRLVRNSSMDNFEKIIGLKGHDKKELVRSGDNQVTEHSKTSAFESSGTTFPIAESSLEASDTSLQQSSKSLGFGQWLWGKESKIVVKDREMNLISPTSF